MTKKSAKPRHNDLVGSETSHEVDMCLGASRDDPSGTHGLLRWSARKLKQKKPLVNWNNKLSFSLLGLLFKKKWLSSLSFWSLGQLNANVPRATTSQATGPFPPKNQQGEKRLETAGHFIPCCSPIGDMSSTKLERWIQLGRPRLFHQAPALWCFGWTWDQPQPTAAILDR